MDTTTLLLALFPLLAFLNCLVLDAWDRAALRDRLAVRAALRRSRAGLYATPDAWGRLPLGGAR